MIEYFGPGIDKNLVAKSIERSICKLSATECGRVAWVVASGETKYLIKKQGCLAVATNVEIVNGGEVMSYIVASPDFEKGTCFLMGATVGEFRGRHLHTLITTKLVESCEKCNSCPIERLIGETGSEKIKGISRKLGFKENVNEFILERKHPLKIA